MKVFIALLIVLPILMAGCELKGKDGKDGNAGGQGQAGAAGQTGATGSPGTPGHDGQDGKDAIVSSGPIGTAVSGGLSACHHDYSYQRNGWLMLRHQKNGTVDQGAGSTGFDVWNVDIMNFILVSEVGAVTYCTLRFDGAALTLEYTVNYAGDGKQGEHGLILLGSP